MDSIELKKKEGTLATIRKNGLIPVVCYGRGVCEHYVIKEDQMVYSYNKLVKLVGINTYEAVLKAVQKHPVTGKIIHADFFVVEKDQLIKVFVPIAVTGIDKSPGIRDGAFLYKPRKRVEVYCTPDSIPEAINCDISNLRKGQVLSSSELTEYDFVKPVPLVSLLETK